MDSQRISEKEGFSFTWVIENFNFCWQKEGGAIMSPAFIADTLEKTKWRLLLYPKGVSDVKEDFISFYLERQEDCRGPKSFTIFYELSFLAADGSVLESSGTSKYSFCKNYGRGFKDFVKQREVFQKRRKEFLFRDILTARCRLWNTAQGVIKNEQCFARTQIGIERRSFLWDIKSFSSFQQNVWEIKSASDGNSIMTLKFLSTAQPKREISLEAISCDWMIKFSTFRMQVLGTSGKGIECLNEEFVFDDHVKTVLFTLHFLKEFLMEYKNLYLPNDILTLQCECAYTTGIAWEGIEMTSYGYPASIQTRGRASNHLKTEKTSLDLTRILQENLETLYKENFLSDTKLSTRTGRLFFAHKNILSARSPVFKAMFTNDMKEKFSECVYIEDLDDGTVHRMLLYVYTAVVKDLQWESASALYAAADKYEIISLKNKCAFFLKNNISPNNACDLLILADMHQDQFLKSVTQEFILKHDSDVMNSYRWNALLEINPELASNTLFLRYKVFIRNLVGDHFESEKTSLDLTNTLQKNLGTLYKENILCDTKLKTETGTFLAHKNILSARSPVFKAMFANDMKEKSSECVYIEDLDDDTVERMLLYLYTAAVEDLQWESAYELYAAADKYEILSLKSMCSSFLKNNLCPDNACELLILANMHLDQYLKSVVQDYILYHKGIFNSKEWKLLMKTNLQLAADIMYLKLKE
ncbi:speckle-type POZ protein B [Nephila pilipes]|uniref:Speckle-type POZ protein B n=1 Tax=Nephila pilipes TaxID=299642 RepID=A0A8X6TF56_NEPPI|nr:speckle-type POZ protein B [Nephila pilipes]